MNDIFKFALFLLLLQSCPAVIRAQNVPVQEYQLNSAVLNKPLRISVRLPIDYHVDKNRYGVLYVVQATGKTVEDIAVLTQNILRSNNIPDMLVVGVDADNEDLDRMRDPGAYDRFLSSMSKELIPHIEKQYRTDGQNILYNRSVFGSFTLYAFLTRPGLFNGYIAATRQWYDGHNDYFNALADKALQTPQSFKGRKIFLATLNGAYNNNNIPEVDKEMAAIAKKIGARSGGRASAGYNAFDDWGISLHPGFSEGLLYVSPKGKNQKAKTALAMTQSADGKWFITDGGGNRLYEVFPYDNGPDYPAEGLIRVIQNGKIGYAHARTYAIVIKPQFDCAFPFENGKAKVSNQCKTVRDGEHTIWESDHWQYVNKQGKLSRATTNKTPKG